MSNLSDSLSDDEVRQIALLVETLDRSAFDYLQVDVGNLKVTIGKGNAPQSFAMGAAPSGAEPGLPAGSQQAPVAATPAGTAAVAAVSAAQPPGRAVTASAQDDSVTIVAPLMGRFYAKPEPGSAPFVSVGTEVNADSTVGLIEVMKVFTAVRAGVSGIVTEVCAQDTEFIEYGHVLFRVRLAATVSDPDLGSAKGAGKGGRS